MIDIELQLDNIDYDKIFAAYYGEMKELLAQSDEPAAGLIARVPEAMAQKIWGSLTVGQKEKIAVKLLQSQVDRYTGRVLERLKEKGVELCVKKASITAR